MRTATFLFLAIAALSVLTPWSLRAEVAEDCTWKGVALYGKVKIVTSFPDVKVRAVTSFPDLKVKTVTSFPDDCGKWQFVESSPDFTVQFVDNFPDVKIQFVESFPGVP